MTNRSASVSLSRFCLVVLVVWAGLVFTIPVVAQTAEHKTAQSAGVDNTKMGPYRALAQLAYGFSQKGDNVTAATLAKILERTWDKSEDYGGDTALSKTNKQLFTEIDKAMDQFVGLLADHPGTAPDPGRLKAAYNNYLEKLRLAD